MALASLDDFATVRARLKEHAQLLPEKPHAGIQLVALCLQPSLVLKPFLDLRLPRFGSRKGT